MKWVRAVFDRLNTATRTPALRQVEGLGKYQLA
jgi:hypothetical protein